MGRAGFTLIELLVALAVLGLLLVGLNRSLGYALAGWHAERRQLEAGADLDAIDRLLRSLLSAGRNGLSGNAETLSLTGRLPRALAVPRDVPITLGLERQRLMVRWREPASAEGGADHEIAVLDRVAKLALAYRGRQDGGADDWHERWAGKTPPRLIRVHLDFAAGDPRHWPDIIVAPIVSADE